jgi:Putative Actinobacterial Holin-X, holin superfamily III
MEKQEAFFASITEKMENYAKTTFELLKLKVVDKSSSIISKLIVALFVFLIFGIIILLISIGLSLWIGNWLGIPWLGFFIVGFSYTFICFLIYYFQNQWVRKFISRSMLSLFNLENT